MGGSVDRSDRNVTVSNIVVAALDLPPVLQGVDGQRSHDETDSWLLANKHLYCGIWYLGGREGFSF